MDLALAFGEPVSVLRERLSEREFYGWSRYAAQHGMPLQRIELLLARIAMFLDLGLLGKKRARLAEYLPDFDGSLSEELLEDDIEGLFPVGTVVKGVLTLKPMKRA